MENENSNQQVNQAPVTAPPAQPVPSAPKSKLLLIISGVLVLLIVGCGAYYVGLSNGKQITVTKDTATPTAATSPTVSPTIQTQTATINSNYYTITYPGTWRKSDYKELNPSYESDSFITLENKINDSNGIEILVDYAFVQLQVGKLASRSSTGGDGLVNNTPTEADFYNPTSNVWKTGNVAGGGPGYTYDAPKEVVIGGKRAMMQQSHPTTVYESATPDQITINYYIPLNKSFEKFLFISFFYNKTNPDSATVLNEFNQMITSLTLPQ